MDLGDRDWYRLPAWYDILHAAGTAEEVDGLEAIASRWVRPASRGPMRWLEPACGTGRYLRVIAGRGGEAMVDGRNAVIHVPMRRKAGATQGE